MGWPTIVTAKEKKKHHGKRNNVKEKHKSVSNFFCAVEMINKYDIYWLIV